MTKPTNRMSRPAAAITAKPPAAKRAARKDATPAAAEPFKKPPATYSHRVSLDLDDTDYDWLSQTAWETRRTKVEVIRALIQEAQRP